VIRTLSDELTPREVEIVRLILEGHPTISVAERLKLRRGTVKNHRLRIYQKLDTTSERELFLGYIRTMPTTWRHPLPEVARAPE
jgi:DNA-binding CsgD family transcriptional regulator